MEEGMKEGMKEGKVDLCWRAWWRAAHRWLKVGRTRRRHRGRDPGDLSRDLLPQHLGHCQLGLLEHHHMSGDAAWSLAFFTGAAQASSSPLRRLAVCTTKQLATQSEATFRSSVRDILRAQRSGWLSWRSRERRPKGL